MSRRFRPKTMLLVVVAMGISAWLLSLWDQSLLTPTPLPADVIKAAPPDVIKAAQSKFKGIAIEGVWHEIVNGQSAWEVRGMDEKGILWAIDITDNGKILMYEETGSHPFNRQWP